MAEIQKEPKLEAQSLDHASRQPLLRSLDISTQCLPFIIKTLTKLQRLSKANHVTQRENCLF